MKKVLALCLALCMMLFGVAGFAEGTSYAPGTYTAEAPACGVRSPSPLR